MNDSGAVLIEITEEIFNKIINVLVSRRIDCELRFYSDLTHNHSDINIPFEKHDIMKIVRDELGVWPIDTLHDGGAAYSGIMKLTYRFSSAKGSSNE